MALPGRLRRTLGLVLPLLLVPVAAAAKADQPPGAVRLSDGAPPVVLTFANVSEHAVEVEMGDAGLLRVEVLQQGVDVVVDVVAPDGSVPDGGAVTQVDSPNGDSGPEMVEIGSAAIPARRGVWRLVIHPFLAVTDEAAGSVAVRIVERLSGAEVAELQRRAAAQRAAARAWVVETAVPLTSVEAGHGFADLAALGRRVGDARVVALGEATHGSRQFFQLKHRLLEYLVSEKGFTAFVIEATLPESLDVDHYVVSGEGDPEKALSALYFWTWDTEEVLALIRWMRDWNADPAHARKVRFYGDDVQFPARAVRLVADYLRRVDPEAAPSLAAPESGGSAAAAPLAFLADPQRAEDLRFGSLPQSDVTAVTAAADALVAQLAVRRHEYVAASSAAEWELAQRLAVVVRQYVEMATVPLAQGSARRDRAMAENTLWALEREGPQGKVVLWAHNYHVSSANPATQGTLLRTALGDDLRVFGFAFARGGFQAVGMGANQGDGLRDFHLDAPPAGSLDALLDQAVAECEDSATAAAWLVDFAALPADGPVAEWFAAPQRSRSFGAAFDETRPDASAAEQVQSEIYDALLFVPETTPARANPWIVRGPLPTAPQVANLGFEDDEPGAEPGGWEVAKRVHLDGVATVETDGCPAGTRCLRLARAAGPRYGESPVSVTQRVEAEAWRGRRLRLTATGRHQGDAEGDAAYLWLRVRTASATLGIRPAKAEERIGEGDWSLFALELDVPEDAVSLEFGLSLVGAGAVWADDFRVETTPAD